jgi:ABC-type Fe3+/spermidine/putrescine transport system ATPase subunit
LRPASASSFKKRPVVRNVSISVKRGEAVGLLGPNGAGKTTTFYMIVGLVAPDTGTISLDGADITPCRCIAAPAGHRLSAAGGQRVPRAERRAEHHGGAGGGRAGP